MADPPKPLATAGSCLLFDIVWDDPDFARFASYVEAGHAACRAEAPEARRRGPQATNTGLALLGRSRRRFSRWS
jgi:hypothetical protein